MQDSCHAGGLLLSRLSVTGTLDSPRSLFPSLPLHLEQILKCSISSEAESQRCTTPGGTTRVAFCCEPRECDLDSLSSAVGLLPGCRVVLNFPLVLVTSHQAGPWQETGQMAAEHSTALCSRGLGSPNFRLINRLSESSTAQSLLNHRQSDGRYLPQKEGEGSAVVAVSSVVTVAFTVSLLPGIG
ncbi:hypothetical protein CB1_099732004 [Camelus ferus]|nr:hypothetical protein CB1_099732004 [Camelus ferus]